MRHRRILAFGLLVVAGAIGSAVLGPALSSPYGTAADEGAIAPPGDLLVRPGEADGLVWPYTSRTRSVDGRTLALNVVLRGDADAVRRALTDRSDQNWTGTNGTGLVDESPWLSAHGSARYTYLTPTQGEEGQWVEAAYQLEAGTYLGRRVHIRAYPSLSGDWTALQVHTEYWDWYRLRHTVTGVSVGARFVERDLRDEPFVDGVTRVYHGQAGGGSDGWVTVIEIAPTALQYAPAVLMVGVGAALHRGRQWTAADVALPTAIVGVLLGVRAAGIAAETVAPSTDPKLFAAVLYPVLALGPPAAVAAFARDRPPTRTAAITAAAFGAALVFDLGTVGVRVVPLRLVLHRTALAGALGMVALGVARRDRRSAEAGLLTWVTLHVASLAGLV